MIKNIHIEGYRIFRDFKVNNLNKINLFVGTNNSGKTSVLEALYLLASDFHPQSLWKILVDRGEQSFSEATPQNPYLQQLEVELNHLFYGNKINLGDTVRITASNGISKSSTLKIISPRELENPQIFQMIARENVDSLDSMLAVAIENDAHLMLSPLPLTSRNTLRQNTVQNWTNFHANQPNKLPAINVQYVSSYSLSAQQLTSAWAGILLTPDEDRVVRALQFLDSNIERIAAVPTPIMQGQKGGFMVKMSQFEAPVPIGTLGDGAWRMLGLAIALIRSRNGILLVDEIDTGLHYSVMTKMWEMIVKASKEFNIQVFATTHSQDCIKALADTNENEISVQRIEPENKCAVEYSAGEIQSATAYNIEMR